VGVVGVKNRYLTSEQRLIEEIADWTQSDFIGDDCARLPGQVLVTTDTLVEGTHFLLSTIQVDELGWKSIAVNLSDVAAMAGRPRYLTVSATLPEYFPKEDFRRLYAAMADCARTYRATIVGGDLTSGPCLVLSVTVIADEHEKGCLTRSGAKAGDVVICSGDFGASRAGLYLLSEGLSGDFKRLRQKHVRPLPRLCESWSIVRRSGACGALMDASDGLADALAQIARASDVGMRIDLGSVPIANDTCLVARMAEVDAIDWALYGGEDYELVGCVPEEVWRQWDEPNPFTKIGEVVEGDEITLAGAAAAGRKLDLSRCFQQIGGAM
jgi:thiamine-monophosphate kinase